MKRLRQAYTALREQTSMSYAKIATISGFCDLDVVVIKATSPDDLPLPERYIHELLKIFSFSHSSFRAFSLSFTSRFGKTRCWRVALKCLILLHRLLRSLPENSPFRSDLLWSRSNGLISLYPCRFQDNSSSSCQDFTAFIHSYARLLDEALECFSLDRNSTANLAELSVTDSFTDKIKEVGRILEVLPQVQSLIDRGMECNPAGAASKSFLVRSAMKHIVRDTFICYNAFSRDIIFLLDNLYQMQYRNSISALGIYKRAATQATELNSFYENCKDLGLCGSYEYPFIDKIPHIHVRALECFLNGMWQLTESSSSTSSSSSSTTMSSSPPTSSSMTMPSSPPTEDEGEKQLTLVKTVISTKWEKFEEEGEAEPLIKLEMDTNVSWEALLEASAAVSCIPRDYYGYGYEYGYRYGYEHQHKHEEESDGWKMQVYNPNSFNPFYHPYNVHTTHPVHVSEHDSPWMISF